MRDPGVQVSVGEAADGERWKETHRTSTLFFRSSSPFLLFIIPPLMSLIGEMVMSQLQYQKLTQKCKNSTFFKPFHCCFEVCDQSNTKSPVSGARLRVVNSCPFFSFPSIYPSFLTYFHPSFLTSIHIHL